MPTPVAGYITRPRSGVSSTVAPATEPEPESDLSAVTTTPPAGFPPIAIRLLKWSPVTIAISTEARAPGETIICCRRGGAMLGAGAAMGRGVLAGEGGGVRRVAHAKRPAWRVVVEPLRKDDAEVGAVARSRR